MTSTHYDDSTADAMGGFMAAAAQNATCGGDIAIATTQVIAKRVALRMAATFNPLRADRAELSRMVPEKVEAFSTASTVMLKQSGQAYRQMMRSASDEIMRTGRATMEMTGCFSPAALAEAQGRFARAWIAPATAGWFAMGTGHSRRSPLRWRPFGRQSSPMLNGSVADGLRLDANLYESPPPRQGGKKGRRLPKPKLCDVLVDEKTRLGQSSSSSASFHAPVQDRRPPKL